MHIIPVIDIKDGIVFHAKHGNRDDYAPLQSALCKSADVFDVIDVFCQQFKPDCIYLADLNAITRQCNNADLVKAVLTAYPKITFWVDAGYPLPDAAFLDFANFVPVLGSESFQDDTIDGLKQFGKDFILSLDFFATGEMGATSLFSMPALWPEKIIIMSLPKVGSNLGPDLARLQAYRQRHPEHTFIAAGGVRHAQDLENLAQLGIDAALIATALHNGQIQPDEIKGKTGQQFEKKLATLMKA